MSNDVERSSEKKCLKNHELRGIIILKIQNEGSDYSVKIFY